MSSSDNPRDMWNTVNNILYHTSANILPSALSFLLWWISSQPFQGQNFTALTFCLIPSCWFSPLSSSSSNTSTDFSVVPPATVVEVLNVIRDCPNKQSSLNAVPTSPRRHCSYLLSPVITCIINHCLATGDFYPQLKHSVITPHLKKPLRIRQIFQPTSHFPVFPLCLRPLSALLSLT